MSSCNSLTNTCCLESSKRNYDHKSIIKAIENILFPLTNNNKLSGFIVYLFHVGICGFAMFYIFLGKVDAIFYMCLLLWAIVFGMHIYFKGCILIKTERYLWDTKEWYGPWSMMFFPLKYFSIEMSKTTSENIFIFFGIMMVIVSALKITFTNE